MKKEKLRKELELLQNTFDYWVAEKESESIKLCDSNGKTLKEISVNELIASWFDCMNSKLKE